MKSAEQLIGEILAPPPRTAPAPAVPQRPPAAEPLEVLIGRVIAAPGRAPANSPAAPLIAVPVADPSAPVEAPLQP